jgi:uncharacterized protein YbjT (DUF2867 family)
MILITGATGNIGAEAVRLLLAEGRPVRALTRDARKLAGVGGIEIAVGDFTKPETLGPALDGATGLLLTAEGRPLAGVTRAMLDAARGGTLRQVVLVSSGTIHIEPRTRIGQWHLDAEELLRGSGVGWTMLRPMGFTSNAARWAGMIKSQGTVFAAQGGPSSPIDPRDIAAVAVRALIAPAQHLGKTHLLTGGRTLTTADQVAAIGAAIGRALRFQPVPDEAAIAGMVRAGLDEELARAIVELIVAGREERLGAGRFTRTVEEITGRPARSFDDWARDHATLFS